MMQESGSGPVGSPSDMDVTSADERGTTPGPYKPLTRVRKGRWPLCHTMNPTVTVRGHTFTGFPHDKEDTEMP